MNLISFSLCIVLLLSILNVSAQITNPTTKTTTTKKKVKNFKECVPDCDMMLVCVDAYVESGLAPKVNGKVQYSVFPPTKEVGKCFCLQGVQYAVYEKCLTCIGASFTKISLNAKCQTMVNDQTLKTLNTYGLGNENNTQNATSSAVPSASSSISINPTGNGSIDNTANDDKKESSGMTGYIAMGVIGCVAVVGVAGFVVYNRKQKRPESMPFYGSSSPNHFATLNSPITKPEMGGSTIISQNPTLNYNNPNTEYYDNNYNYNQNQQGYNNQYDQGENFQYEQNNYQYQSPGYENENLVAGAAAAGIASSYTSNNIESRRESMMPNNSISNDAQAAKDMIYICTYKYDPKLDDELGLSENDQVKILEEYEDGWMKAINITTGLQGMAPRVCIKEQQ